MSYCYTVGTNSIVTIEVIGDTNETRDDIVNPDYAKYKTTIAKVVSIEHPDTKVPMNTDIHVSDNTLVYSVGEIINTSEGIGIYYYKTYDAALCSYYYPETKRTEGTYRSYWDNGNVRGKHNYKDGKKHGKQESWHSNGEKHYLMNYNNSKRTGTYWGWYDNGNLMCEKTYKDGKENGIQLKWYQNGKKEYEQWYKDGKEFGKHIGWNRHGVKIYEIESVSYTHLTLPTTPYV